MSNKKFTTKSPDQTQEVAGALAQEILSRKPQETAVVLALEGDLGAGKTTFLQGFARGLGVVEKITSPTFIVMRRFELPEENFKNFYHIDCYRLESPQPAFAKSSGAAKEMLDLGFEEIIKNPMNIVAIEWPERITKLLPKNIVSLKFKHLEGNQRELTIT